MSRKILVVDDNPEIARTIVRTLYAYDTTSETDPREAVRRFEAGERFALVICDLQMPAMSGREVYEAFQRAGSDRMPVVVMMSGEDNVTALFAAGCPVLFKPFSPPELRALVSALLHEQSVAAPGP